MPPSTDQREAIVSALRAFESPLLADAGRRLFATLGYKSDRRISIATPKQFREQLDPNGKLTAREGDALGQLNSLHLLFQLTNAEFDAHGDMFDDTTALQVTKIESYLFFAAELPPGHYTRTALSTLVRAINKPLPMPALVLFRYGDNVSLGIIHRRLHKRDQTRDVLEKVTLVKDIAFADPIRAHSEILNDFVLANLDADFGVSNFVRLHEAWQKRLDAYALSNDFYREIADWYFWAHHQVEDGTIRLPRDCDTEQEKSLFLIRLLTRVIFCWFLVEKRLIPTDLFREHQLKRLLKEFNPGKDPRKPDAASTYYHAILQNLFFGTLNMPPAQRGFREKKRVGERYDKNFGITNLWRYETHFRSTTDWPAISARTPFLNGGLFDCLDDKGGGKADNVILDGFSDNPKLACHLPNDLFFGPERTVDLSRDYGEEEKRAARSKKAKVRGLIDILSRYKFTIEENTPLEVEIALDPELLGKVFENLLASYNEDTLTTARKALGAFYTPREIVSYMVDEGLKSYLGSQVPRCKGALEDLFSNKATLRNVRPDTRDALIAAIGRVKILDPACGSGAFPMGALHRLVDLLRKLDEQNSLWRELQRRRAIAETEQAFRSGDHASREERLKEINDTFEFNSSDYGRKLYLIENCIYGVDIQPVAVQIAKLRFFISLIVDQQVDALAENLGVRPLPNLETRLVAADTLIPIEKDESDLFTGGIDKLRAELAAIRHEHFNARSPAAKRKWREADEGKRREVAELLEDNHSLPRGSARKLAAWDPYDQNSFAPFFDAEWMFGLPVGKVKIQGNAPVTLLGNLALVNEAGGQTEFIASVPAEVDSGFDIVIGNPPYVRIQTLKKKDPKLVAFYKEQYASAGKGNYDLYVVFIEAGLRLLKADGHLAYICPHKFFNSEYGEPLRALIASGRHLQHIVHFGDQQVFPGATIYTCLLFLSKSPVTECKVVRADDLDAWKATLAGTEGRFDSKFIGRAEWNFAVGRGGDLFRRLMQMPQTLPDVARRVYQGPITSADSVYLFKNLEQVTKGPTTDVLSKQLDQEVKLESSILKRVIRSGDVGRYWANCSALVLFPYEVKDTNARLFTKSEMRGLYPLAWDYLTRNKKLLAARENGAFDDAEWYRFGRNQNLGLWEQPKLMVPYMVTELAAYFDESDHFYFINVTTGGYGITVDEAKCPLPALCALLNSPVLDFCLKRVSSNFQGGYFPANKQFIDQLPIVSPSKPHAATIGLLVRLISAMTRHLLPYPAGQTTRDPLMLAYWERVLNGLVYELYFPEDIHGAGLHLFELVEQVDLPNLDATSVADNLPRLRRLFENLYDGAHPLRIALDKLQTLDTVRIVEGKA
jgi:adenine-specific DNA-methyltransferase